MVSNIVFGILVYLVPLLVFIAICMCCAVMSQRRRNRAENINQHNVPIANAIPNPIQHSSNDNDSPPPPYTAESPLNFDDSLPSYERAVNRPL